ncbi:hypothetical protein Pelo_15695 [Pelomyxa schiedti]|nr:hypothetical protein Pelo_15695 [Pelomyxa schiedti]
MLSHTQPNEMDEDQRRIHVSQVASTTKRSDARLSFVSLSPRGNLLATVQHSDGESECEVVVYRCPSCEVCATWTLTESETISSLAWRPDGKALACLVERGCMLYRIEDGAVWSFPFPAYSEIISSLAWFELHNFPFLPEGSVLEQSFPQLDKKSSATDPCTFLPRRGENLTVLVAYSTSGTAFLYFSGLVFVTMLRISPKLCGLTMNERNSIFAISQETASQVIQTTVDTWEMFHLPYISDCTVCIVCIQHALSHMLASLESVRDKWKDIQLLQKKIISDLSRSLKNNSISTTPQCALLELLCSGTLNPALSYFTAIGQMSFKKILDILSSLHQILFTHVQPSIEHILVHTGKLHRFFNNCPQLSCMAVKAQFLPFLDHTTNFMVSAVQASLEVVGLKELFSSTLKWMQIVKSLNSPDPVKACQYKSVDYFTAQQVCNFISDCASVPSLQILLSNSESTYLSSVNELLTESLSEASHSLLHLSQIHLSIPYPIRQFCAHRNVNGTGTIALLANNIAVHLLVSQDTLSGTTPSHLPLTIPTSIGELARKPSIISPDPEQGGAILSKLHLKWVGLPHLPQEICPVNPELVTILLHENEEDHVLVASTKTGTELVLSEDRKEPIAMTNQKPQTCAHVYSSRLNLHEKCKLEISGEGPLFYSCLSTPHSFTMTHFSLSS